MGWASGVEVFDAIAGMLLKDRIDKQKILETLIEALENQDWDTQQDSQYWDHPMVQAAFRKMNPGLFEFENEDQLDLFDNEADDDQYNGA